jgi:hypothetical protein
MVRGLDLFRQRFREFEGSFVLIGGTACDEWFTSLGLAFRATKDLDIVLIIEVLAPAAVRALRAFVAAGGYDTKSASERQAPPSCTALPNRRRRNFRSC